MTITISGWIGLIIGAVIGIALGIVCGVCISDQWWRKNVKTYSHLIPSMTEDKERLKRNEKRN